MVGQVRSPVSRSPFCCLAALLLCSCATEKTVTTHLTKDTSESKNFVEKHLDNLFISKDGTKEVNPDKRSAFEGSQYAGKEADIRNKAFAGKGFDGSDKQYATTAWNDRKSYGAGRDTPEFIKQAAGVKQNASEWGDKGYDTRSADELRKDWSEARDKQVDHTMNDDAIRKRRELARPRIISSQEQQMKSIEEVRAMMGRDSDS